MVNKVICINDKNRPNIIPLSKWLKEGEIYTVLEVMKCNVQGGLLGFKLEEIDLKGCEPYLYFSYERFAPLEDLPEIEEINTKELEYEI